MSGVARISYRGISRKVSAPGARTLDENSSGAPTGENLRLRRWFRQRFDRKLNESGSTISEEFSGGGKGRFHDCFLLLTYIRTFRQIRLRGEPQFPGLLFVS